MKPIFLHGIQHHILANVIHVSHRISKLLPIFAGFLVLLCLSIALAVLSVVALTSNPLDKLLKLLIPQMHNMKAKWV